MSHFKIHCQEPWFSLLRKGQKSVEGRKNSRYYQQIKPNDIIDFFVGTEKFSCLVTEINIYQDVEDYLRGETLEKALPGVKTIEEGLAIYHSWNSKQEIKKWGFLGIRVQVTHSAKFEPK